jgi:hypothetical protein
MIRINGRPLFAVTEMPPRRRSHRPLSWPGGACVILALSTATWLIILIAFYEIWLLTQ